MMLLKKSVLAGAWLLFGGTARAGAGPYVIGALKESTGTYASGMVTLAFAMMVSAAIVLAR
jgi:hypothetical protein